MEEFLDEIKAYAAAFGIKPSTVVQKSGAGGGNAWSTWVNRRGSPTMDTADTIKKYMKDNPAPSLAPLRDAS